MEKINLFLRKNKGKKKLRKIILFLDLKKPPNNQNKDQLYRKIKRGKNFPDRNKAHNLWLYKEGKNRLLWHLKNKKMSKLIYSILKMLDFINKLI